MRACMRACVRACVCVCMHMCVCVCVLYVLQKLVQVRHCILSFLFAISIEFCSYFNTKTPHIFTAQSSTALVAAVASPSVASSVSCKC